MQQTETMIYAGFGREPIMPETVMPLGGNGLVNREYTGIHDTLYLTCIAFSEDAGEPVLIYTMDTLKSEAFIHPLRAAVSEATGVPGERIFFSCTHTHNAPAVYADEVEGAMEYREVFRKAAIAAATTALEDRTPVAISVGTAWAEGMAFSRHYVYEDGHVGGAGATKTHGAIVGHTDPGDCQAQLIKLERSGKKDILLMNFPIHGTFMSSEANKLVSADAPGTIRQALEETTDYLVAYLIGAAGNQVPNTKAPDNHGLCCRDYGRKVAQYIVAALPELKPVTPGPIQVRWLEHAVPSNKERIDLYDEAMEVTAAYKQGGQEAAKPLLKQYKMSSVWEAYAIRRRKNAADTVMFPLSALRMGELSFVFAPYEMFAQNGQYIKENTPDTMTFVVSCANGAKGYLPMERAFGYGVYECFVTLATPGTAEAVAKEYVKMIQSMKEESL